MWRLNFRTIKCNVLHPDISSIGEADFQVSIICSTTNCYWTISPTKHRIRKYDDFTSNLNHIIRIGMSNSILQFIKVSYEARDWCWCWISFISRGFGQIGCRSGDFRIRCVCTCRRLCCKGGNGQEHHHCRNQQSGQKVMPVGMPVVRPPLVMSDIHFRTSCVVAPMAMVSLSFALWQNIIAKFVETWRLLKILLDFQKKEEINTIY